VCGLSHSFAPTLTHTHALSLAPILARTPIPLHHHSHILNLQWRTLGAPVLSDAHTRIHTHVHTHSNAHTHTHTYIHAYRAQTGALEVPIRSQSVSPRSPTLILTHTHRHSSTHPPTRTHTHSPHNQGRWGCRFGHTHAHTHAHTLSLSRPPPHTHSHAQTPQSRALGVPIRAQSVSPRTPLSPREITRQLLMEVCYLLLVVIAGDYRWLLLVIGGY